MAGKYVKPTVRAPPCDGNNDPMRVKLHGTVRWEVWCGLRSEY